MKKLYFILLTALFSSCTEVDINFENDEPSVRRMNLVVSNNEATIVPSSQITNLQILMFDDNGRCIKVIPHNDVMFDENNIFASTITIPNLTTSITVLANAIGSTYPSQQMFLGATLSEIFLSTTHNSTVPPHYYEQPKSFFEGASNVTPDLSIKDVEIVISRMVSKIVVQLAAGLDFTDNSGKGFTSINAAQKVYINGIDSLFVVDTPAGINLPLTDYLDDAIGFENCQIYKPTTFTSSSSALLSDDITVFPQINAKRLPYVILSVTGTKGVQAVGKGNPLYYGMRIKNMSLVAGVQTAIRSLPRNVVIQLTINNFSGVGSPVHPDPEYLSTLDMSVDVRSWSEYYNAGGIVE
ncbi:MAG: FimB/Mfa2 family fimbrial subunit [Rikenellaceae bacterium]